MITKFVLIVWAGFNYTQMLSVETFDTRKECEAVALTVQAQIKQWGQYVCVPYTVDLDHE